MNQSVKYVGLGGFVSATTLSTKTASRCGIPGGRVLSRGHHFPVFQRRANN